ncbi:unnamed protein product [Pylaiella littoralis]
MWRSGHLRPRCVSLLLLFVGAFCGFLGLVAAKANPKTIEMCGGWRNCLETQNGTEVPLVWFETWNATIQPRLEQLLATSREQQEGWSKEHGLDLVFAGDSTIIQQFQVLGEFMKTRSDYHPVTGPDAERQQKYELSIGGARSTPGSVTFIFIRVFEGCVPGVSSPAVKNAYAMYFGCGLHLLHLWPTKGPAMSARALHSWAHYDTLLRESVDGWRKGNPNIKLVFMSTHTIDEGKFVGPWHDTLEGYKARDPVRLKSCMEKYDEALPGESPLRGDLEQACIDTVLGARGVHLLNDRGLAVMKEVGVPVVPAHEIVEEQHWATAVSKLFLFVTDAPDVRRTNHGYHGHLISTRDILEEVCGWSRRKI